MAKSKTVALGDILNHQQVKMVAQILNKTKGPTDAIQDLVKYLARFTKELEARGIDHRYLAYAILAWAKTDDQKSSKRKDSYDSKNRHMAG